MAEIRCAICGREFSSSDSLAQHVKDKHREEINEKKPLSFKKIRNWIISILILTGIIALIAFLIINYENLPPTTMEGHVESNPPSHILKEPMPLTIQKHMLEHADGEGSPGVIINYNCMDYNCEQGMIEKLEEFAARYDYVYVAPFKGMDAKIALTKLDRIEVLEEYDKDKIENFITS